MTSSLPIDQMREFCAKYKIGEQGFEELQSLIDGTLLHVARGLMNEAVPVPKKKKTSKKKTADTLGVEQALLGGEEDNTSASASASPKKKKKTTKSDKGDRKKCIGVAKSSNKPCRYYALEDSEFCKSHQKDSEGASAVSVHDDESVETEVVSCNGMTKGKPCKQKGVKSQPEGAQFSYCCKHKSQWQDYEGEDAVVKEIEKVVEEPVENPEEKEENPEEIETGSTTDSSTAALFGPETSDEENSEQSEQSEAKSVLSEEQEVERVANDMTVDEYTESVDMYDSIEKDMQKKMEPEQFEEWKNNQQLDESTVEKAVEKVKKTKKTAKRPSSWVKKQQEKMLRNKAKIEQHDKEMLGEIEDEE